MSRFSVVFDALDKNFPDVTLLSVSGEDIHIITDEYDAILYGEIYKALRKADPEFRTLVFTTVKDPLGYA